MRTRTHFCDIRNTKLYENPEYASKKRSSLETSKDSKRQISIDRIMKVGKVAKVVEADGVQEDLGPGQVKMLTKEVASLSKYAIAEPCRPLDTSPGGKHCSVDSNTRSAEAQPVHCEFGYATHNDRSDRGD